MKKAREFFRITTWVLRIYWSISSLLTSVVLVTQVILQLQTVVYGFVTGVALDRVIALIQSTDKNPNELIKVILYFVVVELGYNVIGTLNNRASNMLGNRDTWILRTLLYEHMHKLGLATLENPELTNKTTRFNEMYGFINQHVQLVIGLVAAIVSLIISGLIVGNAIPALLPFLLVFFVVKFFINQKYIKQIWNFTRTNTEYRRKAGNVGGTLTDPQSLKELLITRGTSYMKRYYQNYVAAYVKEMDKIYSGWVRFELLQAISDSVLYGLGLYLILAKGITGLITIGTITFLIRSLGSFTSLLDTLTYRVARTRESAIRIRDAQEIFDSYAPEHDGEIVLSGSKTPPQIDFNNVSFAYPDTKSLVIKDLNIQIKPGEKIAIVGENGAGKTTLVKLLARLYRTTEGQIVIDNINVNDVKIQTLYDKLGILFQDYNTYGQFTVLENVSIGKMKGGKFNKKKVIQALKDAQAFEFVQKYPNKLNQILSERYKGGIRPSTGQWQKIAIARFFYRNAPILILDEPTASIDAVSEAQIFDNIYKFMKGKTVIIISHRFSTVRNADRILVLDKGKIIEDGSHEQLMKLNGKYAHAFNLQAKGYS